VISFVLANGGAIRNGSSNTATGNLGGTHAHELHRAGELDTARRRRHREQPARSIWCTRTVTGNTASQNGGGLAQEDVGTLAITDSHHQEQQRAQGGGLFSGYSASPRRR
jgi:hypothetical protein